MHLLRLWKMWLMNPGDFIEAAPPTMETIINKVPNALAIFKKMAGTTGHSLEPLEPEKAWIYHDDIFYPTRCKHCKLRITIKVYNDRYLMGGWSIESKGDASDLELCRRLRSFT